MKTPNPLLPKVKRDKRRKLTEKKIGIIKSMIASGKYTLKDVANKFGVQSNTIRYHTDEGFKQKRIAAVTAALTEKLKDPQARKEQNRRNSEHYFRLMKIPGNRKKWQNYHRQRSRMQKELA